MESLFIYDGDCGFCTRSVTWLLDRARPAAQARPYQRTDLAAFGTTAARARHEALWVTRDARGRTAVRGGVQAFAALLGTAAPAWRIAGLLLATPPIRWIALAVYRLVATNRYRLPGGTAACAVPSRDEEEPHGRA
ncbi:thiol-disulfide oxidoreductase DCC family protein [Nonomuraea sp. NPDC048826]|uniref:thiol-disulfide oxidoreductase DCC family protein n=1 Tax=Nonomuraea sp. NPDC048826 TaxID=3364347 RepID=UPI00371A00F3